MNKITYDEHLFLQTPSKLCFTSSTTSYKLPKTKNYKQIIYTEFLEINSSDKIKRPDTGG